MKKIPVSFITTTMIICFLRTAAWADEGINHVRNTTYVEVATPGKSLTLKCDTRRTVKWWFENSEGAENPKEIQSDHNSALHLLNIKESDDGVYLCVSNDTNEVLARHRVYVPVTLNASMSSSLDENGSIILTIKLTSFTPNSINALADIRVEAHQRSHKQNLIICEFTPQENNHYIKSPITKNCTIQHRNSSTTIIVGPMDLPGNFKSWNFTLKTSSIMEAHRMSYDLGNIDFPTTIHPNISTAPPGQKTIEVTPSKNPRTSGTQLIANRQLITCILSLLGILGMVKD